MIWRGIQNNKMPEAWLLASYDTSHSSLAHWLADFVDKVKFWNQQIDKPSRVYNIAAFYDPR
jgi:hypothetical protein